jgi:acid phosphatase (class A)
MTTTRRPRDLTQISLAGVALLTLSACATTSPIGAAASVVRTYTAPETGSGLDWAVILPASPNPDSSADRLDRETVSNFQSLKNTPRWAQARADASLNMMEIYAPIIGPEFTPARRPEVVALLAYAGRKFSEASNESKSTFPRPRPFMADPSLNICTDTPPAGSSYPSGHAGWGWLSAQIMARVEPTRTQALLARGLDYGTSRVVCGVHYPSDVVAGRLVGDAILARLDNDPRYHELLSAAKAKGK